MRCMNFKFFSGQIFLCSKAILHRRSGWSSDIVLGIDPAVRLRSVSMRSILVHERNELHCLFHTLHSWFSRNECAKYPITAWCDLEFVHVTIERSLLLDSATKLFRTKPYFESQKKKDLHLNHQTNKIIPVSKTIDQTFKIISIFSLRGTIVFMPFIGWRYQFYQWDENNSVCLLCPCSVKAPLSNCFLLKNKERMVFFLFSNSEECCQHFTLFLRNIHHP